MGLSLTISESNVSKEDNTSKITATLKISSSASWNYDSRSGYIQIDGTKYSFSHSFSIGTTTLATKSKTVTHDSDGGGSITVKGYYSTGVSLGNLSISKTYKLTQIDRTYTIKFNSNTTDTVSNMPSSQTKTYGKTLTLSSKVPTRTGYTFKEWNTSKSGTGTSYKPGGSYKTNAAGTLYAIWTENTYSVKFTLPSGYATFTSNSSNTITVTYKYTQTDGKIPTINVATGYYFKGFNIDGKQYASGAPFKTAKGSVSVTSVTATSADFDRLTAKLTFTGDNITTFYMEQGTGTSFKMPTYPGTLTETYEFKYWTDGSNRYYTGSSYIFSSNTTLTAYIGTKADEIFRYYVPTTIESSNQQVYLFLTNYASIGNYYTIPSNSPGNKVENGTYQFKYWTTTANKKFAGATYNYVIPKILLDTIENGFSGNYNSEYDLYKVGWIDSSISEGDGKTFYAVYVDITKSPIKVSGNNFAYIKDTKDTTGSGAQAVQKDYSDYILNNIEDNDIVLHSDKFVAYVKYTLPSEEVKLNIDDVSIKGSNTSEQLDQISYLDQISNTKTLITIGLETYIFFSGAIYSQAEPRETTTITISGVKDIFGRDVDDVSFSIKPPKIIRDISSTGDIISLFNQNYTKLSGNNELQIEGDLRLFGTNIYLGANGDAPLSLESSELIRKYQYEAGSYGALTGYTGNAVGTLTGSAKFDVVSMTWNEDVLASSSSLMQVGYKSETSKPYFTLGDRQSSSSITIGDYSLSVGYDNIATSDYSVAIGDTCQSTAIGAIALGRGNTASNSDAVSIGYENTASGNSSTALGCVASASGNQSVSIGYHTSASYAKQFVCGAYNASSNAIFIVGNGTGDLARNNALELSSSGSLTLAGGITVANHSSAIGTVVSDYLTAEKSCPTATGTEVCSVTLDTGVWLLIGAVRFPGNATGIRRANFSTTSGSTEVNVQITAGSSTLIQLRITKLAVVTSNSTTVYLNAYHNAGTALILPTGSAGDLQGGAVNAITAVRIA